jgi:hypothetical protein
MSAPLYSPHRARASLCGACAALAALALGACGQTVSSASFKGEQHEVAQALAKLQSDVSTSDAQKICKDDLASAVVARLGSPRGGCKAVIKDQLGQIDGTSLRVDAVTLAGSGARRTASAAVRSIYGGKTRRSTVSLVKEAGKWKIAAVQ